MMEEVPQWGAGAFAATARRRLRTRELPPAIAIRHVNFLLLGPAGVGKSSLVHTAWRALSGSGKSDPGLLERLQVGWTADEAVRRKNEGETGTMKPGGLRARHGTTALTAYALQSRLAEKDVRTSFFAQDSKGQQFYDVEETSFAEKLVAGILKNGSSVDRESVYFWAIAAKVGLGRFVKTTALAHSPHAVVLVFDMTLRSFQRAVRGADAALLDCYRQVARHAKALGLTVFAVLTHVDVYERQVEAASRVEKSESGPSDEKVFEEEEAPATEKKLDDNTSERRVGEIVADDVNDFRTKLAKALGEDLVPAANVFPIVNYNVDANDRDDALELAALEFLKAVFDAAEAHLTSKFSNNPNANAPRCRLS
mmetsp:Transcript_4066/g.12647  ORF Transcript_4066/g.12647 Transcript_4066/m.12647 type:complete len:368 (-) Transcript_4066:2612-3715(-)